MDAKIAIAAMVRSSVAERAERAASTRDLTAIARPVLLRRQIGRRNQHAELAAPDDDALIVLQVDARRDGVALAAFEGAQAPEIDEHRVAEVGIFPDAG